MSEAWELDPHETGWLEAIIIKLLQVDIPPTAIAKAFNLEVEPVKELLIGLRVEKYGTAELGEAMHALMWEAYNDVRTLIARSAPSRRLQLDMALLSKASALVGGGTPDSIAKMQAEFSQLAKETRGLEMTGIYESDTVDAPIDDPEKGSVNRASESH